MTAEERPVVLGCAVDVKLFNPIVLTDYSSDRVVPPRATDADQVVGEIAVVINGRRIARNDGAGIVAWATKHADSVLFFKDVRVVGRSCVGRRFPIDRLV